MQNIDNDASPDQETSGEILPFIAALIVVCLVFAWIAHKSYSGASFTDSMSRAKETAAFTRGGRGELMVIPIGKRRAEVIYAITVKRSETPIGDAEVKLSLKYLEKSGYDMEMALPEVETGTYRRSLQLPQAGSWEIRVVAHMGRDYLEEVKKVKIP